MNAEHSRKKDSSKADSNKVPVIWLIPALHHKVGQETAETREQAAHYQRAGLVKLKADTPAPATD